VPILRGHSSTVLLLRTDEPTIEAVGLQAEMVHAYLNRMLRRGGKHRGALGCARGVYHGQASELVWGTLLRPGRYRGLAHSGGTKVSNLNSAATTEQDAGTITDRALDEPFDTCQVLGMNQGRIDDAPRSRVDPGSRRWQGRQFSGYVRSAASMISPSSQRGSSVRRARSERYHSSCLGSVAFLR
jgi:hypothetical protein